MGKRIAGLILTSAACFLMISCDSGDDLDGCISHEQLAMSDCIRRDIIGPPGLCEPLECTSETLEFTLPPGDPEECNNSAGCNSLFCRDSSDAYTDLRINEDGNVEGTVIIFVDAGSETFVCR